MITCLVGPSAAGKTTAAMWLRDNRGFQYLEASDFVRRRYAQDGGRGKLLDYVDAQFSAHGRATFCKDLVSVLPTKQTVPLVISGFRAVEECEELRRLRADVRVIAIYAHSKLRYDRFVLREGSLASDQSYLEFVAKDLHEMEYGVARLTGQYRDELVVNESTFDTFYRSMAELFPL